MNRWLISGYIYYVISYLIWFAFKMKLSLFTADDQIYVLGINLNAKIGSIIIEFMDIL